MKHFKLWHLIRLHKIRVFPTAMGIRHHCDCGHYWIESYD